MSLMVLTGDDAGHGPEPHSSASPHDVLTLEARLHVVRHGRLDQDIEHSRAKGQRCPQEMHRDDGTLLGNAKDTTCFLFPIAAYSTV